MTPALLYARISRDEGDDGRLLRRGDPGRARRIRKRGGQVSPALQPENRSVGNQLAQGREWCAAQGHVIAAEFIDEDYSGTRRHRPGLDALLAWIAEHPARYVIVVRDGNRLARGRTLPFHLRYLLEESGCSLISLTEIGDPEMLVSFRALAGAEYIECLRRTIRSSLARRAGEGRRMGGKPPYGYRWADDLSLVPVPGEAAQIARAGELADPAGPCWRLSDIGRALGWHRVAVVKRLRHPVYAGAYVYGRRGPHADPRRTYWIQRPAAEWTIRWDHHEPIIPRDRWERIQERLDAQSAHYRAENPGRATLALTGLLRCADCGQALNCVSRYHLRRSGVMRYTYRCRSEDCRDRRSSLVRGGAAALLPRLLEAMHSPAWARGLAQDYARVHESGVQLGALEAEMRQVQRSIQSVEAAIGSGELLDARSLIRRLADLQRREESLRASLAASRGRASILLSPAQIQSRLRRLLRDLDSLRGDPEIESAARPILHRLVERIPVQRDGSTAEIHLRSGAILSPVSPPTHVSGSQSPGIAVIPWKIHEYRAAWAARRGDFHEELRRT